MEFYFNKNDQIISSVLSFHKNYDFFLFTCCLLSKIRTIKQKYLGTKTNTQDIFFANQNIILVQQKNPIVKLITEQ